MLTQSDVASLYVALFGRASEGEGNSYWQSYDSLEEAAQVMLETTDSQEYFGETLNENQVFIENIYENTLNKTIDDDPEGISYWTAQLDAGKTKGEVAAKLIEAIKTYAPGAQNYNPDDEATVYAYNQFENRVKISNMTADNIEKVPEDYKTSLSFNENLHVTGDDTMDTLYTIEQELAQTYDFEAHITDLVSSPFQEITMSSEIKQYDKENQVEDQNSDNQDITNTLAIDPTPLTEDETDSLVNMYQKEKLAMDDYTATEIADSENAAIIGVNEMIENSNYHH